MAQQELNRQAQLILRFARQESVRLGHGYVGTEHLLLAAIKIPDSSAEALLRSAGIEPAALETAVTVLVGVGAHGCPPCQGLTDHGRQCIELAVQESISRGSTSVSPEHLFLALLRRKDTMAGRMLLTSGCDIDALYRQAAAALGEGGSAMPFRSKPKEPDPVAQSRLLEQFSKDLTRCAAQGELDPVAGRAQELDRMMEILCRRTKNNPILLGDPGVGKTAMAEALAQRIADETVPEPLRGLRILTLDLSSVIAGTKYRGEFEDRLRKILKEVKRLDHTVLFLDEVHTLVGAGSAEGAIDAANLLKPALGRGEIQIIGATTQEEYRKFICKDPALERRFQPIYLEPPTSGEALSILRLLRPRYESHHHVVITDKALRAAVRLSQRYLPDRFLPDKAIDLMDEAAARVRIRGQIEPEEIRLLERRHKQAADALQTAVAQQDFEQAAQLRDAEENFLHQWTEARKTWAASEEASQLRVEEEDIAAVLSCWTGIPVTRITEGEASRLMTLEQTLNRRIVGQRSGVAALAAAIRRSRSGLQEENRPVGSFLFAGPSGVGKTELSRTLAKALFGSEDALIRLDMSEFSEGHSISRLIGSPPGYVGHEEGGQLTEGIRRHPYSVVLFDELEKANDQVWNLLLQILEDGFLTDSQGKKADFRNAVLILTSNLGSQTPVPLGFGKQDTKDYARQVDRALRQTFRPEFLNRLDEIICFTPLTSEEVSEIARRMVHQFSDRLSHMGIALSVEEEAYSLMAQKGYDQQYGARPLRRYLRRQVENPAAELLLAGSLKAGQTLQVGCDQSGIHLDVV